MKKKILMLLATAALAVPSMGQTVYIGDAVSNGDFEAGTILPFDGMGASIADNTAGGVARSGQYSMQVDLTANNGEGQWKLLTTPTTGTDGLVFDVEDDVNAGLAFSGEMWVYVPASAGIGTPEVATAQIKLETSNDGGVSYDNGGALATNISLDLAGLARDTWREVAFEKVLMPAGTTHVRTRATLIATVVEVNGLAADGGADGSGGVGPATPADWNAAGYSGVLYVDDFRLESVLPPDPAILLCEDINNADLETGVMTPWSVQSAAGSIGTFPSEPVHSGDHSLCFEVAVNGDGNQWKQFNNVVNAPVNAGDRISGQVWVYVPTSTTIDSSRGRFNFVTRSNNGNAGNGRLSNEYIDIRPGNHPRDIWVLHTWEHIAVDGLNTITAINTGGWNLETQAASHPNQANYSGPVYLDDFKLVNLGPPPPGVIVNDQIRNGDMEDPGVAPWSVSGAGSVSTDQNHTPGGSQSIKVDLTRNNSASQWKGLHTGGLSHPIETYTKADITAWVYVPSEVNGTKFGGTAKLNLPIRDGGTNIPGAPTIDLTTAARDTWVKVEVLDFDVSGFTTSLALNNWNVETELLVGGAGTLVRADGSDGTAATGSDTGADLPGPAVPQDWIDAGYEGCFYIDDISARLHSPVTPVPLVINSITRDSVTGDVTINYDSSFIDGADVFYSDNGLADWTFLNFSNGTGTDQTYVDLAPASSDRLYILAEPNTTPPDPTP